MSQPYYLQTITLKNYRCFKLLTVDFDPLLTVLVANNGKGKTAVLDALSIALSPFVSVFGVGREAFKTSDARFAVIPSDIFQMEQQRPCVLTGRALFGEKPVEWECWDGRQIGDGLPLFQVAEQLNQLLKSAQGAEVNLPVIAYYSTGRLWSKDEYKPQTPTGAEFASRMVGYRNCLNSSSSYTDFVDWFAYITSAHNELRNQNYERFGERGLKMETAYSLLLDAVSHAVDQCLSGTGWGKLRFSSIYNAPVVEHQDHGVLEVRLLSDGLRSMIALVADLAGRAVRLNPQLKQYAAQQSPGIVLIDEVDMHLHPSWQQQILQQLRSVFPMFQFIVTTHSPQVLSTIKHQHIRLLGENQNGEMVAAMPLAESYARSNADVLETVMSISPTPKVAESALLSRYAALVEQGDLADPLLTEWERQLQAVLGSDHPDLIRLAMVKRRREILG